MMKLRNSLFFGISVFALVSCGQRQKDTYEIKGKLDASDATFVYLQTYIEDSAITDSVRVNNGAFEFKGKCADPAIYYLYTNTSSEYSDALRFVLENASYTIEGNEKELSRATVKGAIEQGAYNQLKELLDPIDQQYADLDEEYAKISEDDAPAIRKLDAQWDQLGRKYDSLSRVFIKNNPERYASLIAIDQMSGGVVDPQVLDPLLAMIHGNVRNTPLGRAMINTLNIAKSTQPGKPAKDFTQNDVNGNPVTLSSFQGKYILLDFWASWCGPCRKENPVVVKAYEKYKNKNFEIVGVSLDKDKDKWIDAIKKDQLTWVQVSELNMFNNTAAKLYGVQAIPQNFLIDPKGVIIAKDLRGDELEKKLAEVLK